MSFLVSLYNGSEKNIQYLLVVELAEPLPVGKAIHVRVSNISRQDKQLSFPYWGKPK